MRRAIVPILCFAVGCGAVVQIAGWNERSHYAQVRAFAAGTPRIDKYVSDTGDRAFHAGHYYSDKAPGLAFLASPAYSVTRGIGATYANESREIHLLSVFGCLIPAALLLLIVCAFVEQPEAGRGLAVSLMLGLGSLLLPFSTLFFSHALSACLGFAAYYLLWLGRSREKLLLIGLAGTLAGLAVSTEYPLAIIAVLLAGYALGWPVVLKRAAAYAGGALVGLAPLLVYNWWAFGSPTRISYADEAGQHAGLLGLVPFSPHTAVDVLFGTRGLLTLTPVLAAALVGIVLVYREGRKTEASMAAAVVVAYLLYNSSLYVPFGGWSPGPRFLIPVIPFLGLPLAVALRRLPALTVSLAVVSAAMMIAATLTRPELPSNLSTSAWWDRLLSGQFTMPGAAGSIVWFGAFTTAAVFAGARLTGRLALGRYQLVVAALGLLCWVLVAGIGQTVEIGRASALAILLPAASLGLMAVAAAISGRRLARREPTQA